MQSSQYHWRLGNSISNVITCFLYDLFVLEMHEKWIIFPQAPKHSMRLPLICKFFLHSAQFYKPIIYSWIWDYVRWRLSFEWIEMMLITQYLEIIKIEEICNILSELHFPDVNIVLANVFQKVLSKEMSKNL